MSHRRSNRQAPVPRAPVPGSAAHRPLANPPAAPQMSELAAGVDGHPLTECRVCGSTDRGPSQETSRQFIEGRVHIWLRTKCTACGQARVDRVTADAPAVVLGGVRQ